MNLNGFYAFNFVNVGETHEKSRISCSTSYHEQSSPGKSHVSLCYFIEGECPHV